MQTSEFPTPTTSAEPVADAAITAAIELLFRAQQEGTVDLVAITAGPAGPVAEKAHLVITAHPGDSAAHDQGVASWAWGLASELPGPAQDLAQVVRKSLESDGRIISSQLLVQAYDGVVTLAGTVCHQGARWCAEQDARGVPGVSSVRNLLKVRP